jgi:hypothetical protein
MGYVKLLTGSGDAFPGSTVLIPADNVASLKETGGQIFIKYFGGYELLLSLDGEGQQEDAVTLIEAINKANGNSGKPVLATLRDSTAEYVFIPSVQAWTP